MRKPRATRKKNTIAAVFGPTHTVFVDCEITRRKSFHLIREDATGKFVWRERRYCDVLKWLHDEGVQAYTLVSEELGFSQAMRLDLQWKEPVQ